MFTLLCKFFALLVCLLSTTSSIKVLIENPGFDSPDAWFSGHLPCPLDEVVFPEDYSAVLPLPTAVDVSGFILPRDGALLLSDYSIISFGSEKDVFIHACGNGDDHKAYIKPARTRKWYDPKSWIESPPVTTQNTVQPHMTRVPCDNENVVLPANGPLSIDLEYATYLRMGELSFIHSLISQDELKTLLNTDLGQLMFKNNEGVTVQFYHNDICGCHEDYPKFIEPICHNIAETCPRPHCTAPVTPYESCCAICGAILKFAVEECDDSKAQKLRTAILAHMVNQSLTDELDYYVSYINSKQSGNYLQAFVVDRHTYAEKSVAFVRHLNATADWTKLFNSTHRLEVKYAGRVYTPGVTFGSILLIILCVLLVSVVALVIFAHYAPENRYVRRIPQWIHDPRRLRALLLRSPFVFARFDNAGAAGPRESNVQESVIMGYNAQRGELRERAFDNPMFGGEPISSSSGTSTGRVQKLSVKATDLKPTLEIVTLVDDMEGDDEQELTEIKLESSSEGSGDEQETKE